jgi:hypothetical protein
MSRRRAEGDPGVGSDSFLDVIANIVGILIILIVLAGVRVSRAPVAMTPESSVESGASDDRPDVAPPTEESPVLATAPPPAAPRSAPALVTEPIRIEPSPELLRQFAALEQELSQLAAEISNETEPLGSAHVRGQDLAAKLTTAEGTLSAAAGQLQHDQQRLSALQRQVDLTRGTLLARQTALAEIERAPPAARPIHHRLTPLSRPVEGQEIHFQLQGGRLAYVPVDDLVELLKTDINRQKDWLARVPRYEGLVGPVGGFSMAYVVERQSLSALDALRVGGVVRISVTEWRIVPGPQFPSETAAEALSPGSAFIRRLQMIDLGTALTFWVYPDSFSEFRELQELARAEGFTVAARPLPIGTPIAASPQGTRSAGQ